MIAKNSPGIVIAASSAAALSRTKRLAASLGLALVADWRRAPASLALVVDVEQAWLQRIEPNPPGPVSIDFAAPAMEHRRKGGHNELLGRAVGIKQGRYPGVFDATAGLGRDGFVLADSGCRVSLCERSSVLSWLLEQAIEQGLISGIEHVRKAATRLSVIAGDARDQTVQAGTVIYLDPMFPERRSQSGVKKDLAVLQILHGGVPSDEAESEALLEWALQQDTPRIVVKRPLKAPVLGRRKPAYELKGKAIRFDVYVLGDLG